MKNKKAIIYVRVSTDEQLKGYSPAHQEEMLRRYCVINNIEIVALFNDDHSAKSFNRPAFNNMLDFLRRNKGAVNFLLFLKWDRFSRNAPEAYSMINKLHKLGIEPQAIEQPLNMEIPEQKFLLALYLTAPEVENDRRALNIHSGIRKAMKGGRYMGSAPYGYRHSRSEQNKPIISPCPATKKMLQQCFEMMATGEYQIEELRKQLNKKGMPLGRSRFWYMLRNPTYIAKVYVPAYKDDPAMIVKGTHEPIISDALFYEVQDVLDGRKRKLPPSPFCMKDELPLRGFLECGKCGRRLTGSSSKGRSSRYHYYHCKFGCKERFRADEANDVFYDVLKSISSNEKVLRSFELIMSGVNSKNGTDKKEEVEKYKKELATYEARMDNAQTLMLDGKLEITDYQNIKAKLEPEIERLLSKVGTTAIKESDESDMIRFGFHFLNNLDKLFTSADLVQKRNIIGSTFPEKLIFENNAYRTASEDSIVLLIAATGKGSRQKKESRQENFCLLSRRVVATGIEPVSRV